MLAFRVLREKYADFRIPHATYFIFCPSCAKTQKDPTLTPPLTFDFEVDSRGTWLSDGEAVVETLQRNQMWPVPHTKSDPGAHLVGWVPLSRAQVHFPVQLQGS